MGEAAEARYGGIDLTTDELTEEPMRQTEGVAGGHQMMPAAEEHDILIMVTPWMAHHVLRLLADDIARPTDVAPDWRLQVLALACYIRDVLPDSLRIPLPSTDELSEADPADA